MPATTEPPMQPPTQPPTQPPAPPAVALRFVKGHGTENDFILLPDPDGAVPLSASLVRALCDRRAGIGADGVLRVVRSAAAGEPVGGAADALWFMDYWNADGSLAEMCGNGARVYARYLVAAGLLAPGEFQLATRGGPRTVRVGRAGEVSVDLGPVRIGGRAVARLGGRRLTGTVVSVGNPHLVCLGDQPVDAYDLSVPPTVPTDVFPHGANVEVARIVGERQVEMRVHERGSGETRSCGTGACAVAALAAHRSGTAGAAGTSWTVLVPGGRLTVQADNGPEARHWLSGPAELVAEGMVDSGWLAARSR